MKVGFGQGQKLHQNTQRCLGASKSTPEIHLSALVTREPTNRPDIRMFFSLFLPFLAVNE